MKIGVYPGTFDPVTNGHVDIVKRSLRVFDKVIVAVAPNSNKRPLFDLAERVEMVKLATKDLPNVEVEAFDGLLVNYSQKRGARAIIRGLRAISDFEYEFQMALMNRKLDTSVETMFFMPSEEYSYLTSGIVKEVAGLGGALDDFVHPEVAARLRQRLRGGRP
ncbi:MAG TPA: pantetheine-phosphate adenylyltransferase [Nitrospiraceae bacterium]|jgi:pantetheine-phosphate adenylyltransferase|nr:pantetheine-phosphate adenylyltransferase [Nitrospiraceae bacterium]